MFTGQSLGSRGGTGSPESLSAGCEPGCPTPPPKGPRAECGNQPGSGAPGPSSTGFPAPLAGTPRYVAAFRASSATSSGRPHHVRKRTNALVSLGAALSLSPSDPAWGSRRPSSGRLAASRFPAHTQQHPAAPDGSRWSAWTVRPGAWTAHLPGAAPESHIATRVCVSGRSPQPTQRTAPAPPAPRSRSKHNLETVNSGNFTARRSGASRGGKRRARRVRSSRTCPAEGHRGLVGLGHRTTECVARTTRTDFPTGLEAGKSKVKVWAAGFLGRALSLARRRPPPPCARRAEGEGKPALWRLCPQGHRPYREGPTARPHLSPTASPGPHRPRAS